MDHKICMYLESSILQSDRLAILSVVEVPRVGDHQLEVFVIVNAGRYVGVVIVKLVQRDLPISLLRVLVSA